MTSPNTLLLTALEAITDGCEGGYQRQGPELAARQALVECTHHTETGNSPVHHHRIINAHEDGAMKEDVVSSTPAAKIINSLIESDQYGGGSGVGGDGAVCRSTAQGASGRNGRQPSIIKARHMSTVLSS